MSINVAISGIKGLEKALTSYAKTKTEELRDTTKMSAINVERNAKGNVRVNDGRFRASIRARHSTDEIESDVYTDVFYAPFEEFGTGRHVQIPAGLEDVANQFKGSGGGSFSDLLDNIKVWTRQKGIDPSAAYPIAAKIAREGRPGKPFLYPAWEQERPKYVENVKRVLRRI